MSWLAIFTAAVIYDAIFARWSDAVAAKRPIAAGAYAAGIMACSGFVTVNFVHDPWLLVPAASGAFLGTWVAVRRSV